MLPRLANLAAHFPFNLSFFPGCSTGGIPEATKPVAATAPEAAGERPHVTVMFCDFVDSTVIAAKLDAEE